jgi:hypothetical protein
VEAEEPEEVFCSDWSILIELLDRSQEEGRRLGLVVGLVGVRRKTHTPNGSTSYGNVSVEHVPKVSSVHLVEENSDSQK